MNPLIQITGLPRSGTAFVSTLLNLNPDCIAFHELASTDLKWRDTIAEARLDYEFVADVTTYGFLPKVVDRDATKVFIDIPWRESLNSAAEAFGVEPDGEAYESLHSLAKDWMIEHDPLVINSSELWTVDSLKAIWLHCFGFDGMHFPEAKVKLLIGMNIQRNNPKELFGHDCFVGRHEEFV